MKLSRMGIQKQVLILVLGCALLTLVIAGGVALYGMFGVRSQAIRTGVDIGETAAERSSEALREHTQRSMSTLANERSTQINYIFDDTKWDVEAISDVMTKIMSTPTNYVARYVAEPDRSNAGRLVPQLQYAPNVDRAALQSEIALAANIEDWLLQLNDGSGVTASTYIASESGFGITVDDRSDRKLDAGSDVPFAVDFRTRPWYVKAVDTNGLIFTDVFKDIYSDELAMTCAAPYYDAYGNIAGVVGEGVFLDDVNDIVLSTKMGTNGFGFIMDKNGKVLFSPKTEGVFAVDGEDDPSLFEDSSDPTLVAATKMMASGENGVELVTIDGAQYYLAYAPLDAIGCSFGIVLEVAEILAPVELNRKRIEENTGMFIDMLNQSITSTFVAMLIAVAVFLMLIPFLGRRIAEIFVRPIRQLTEGVREIASGNLDKKLDIHTGNEIESLALSFNAMTDELKSYMENLTKVTSEKERIATELNVATNIQISMLPREFDFNRSDFEIYATMHAAKEVGGDFYDFYLLDDKHLVLTIADVSGKGVPAALFMAISKTILHNFALSMSQPDDFASVMALSNQQLCQGNDEMMFVTVFMAMLDLSSGRLIYVNGGHNPPMLYRRAEDRFEYLSVERNVVLGMMEDMDYVQQETTLGAGDIIYLYTDGVTEAMDVNNKQYGEARLSSCLNGADKAAPLDKILSMVASDLSKHVGAAAQSDDITMLAVRFRGQS